jgi:hypothetical protein
MNLKEERRLKESIRLETRALLENSPSARDQQQAKSPLFDMKSIDKVGNPISETQRAVVPLVVLPRKRRQHNQTYYAIA